MLPVVYFICMNGAQKSRRDVNIRETRQVWVFLILDGVLGVGCWVCDRLLEAYELSSYLDNSGLAQEHCLMS